MGNAASYCIVAAKFLAVVPGVCFPIGQPLQPGGRFTKLWATLLFCTINAALPVAAAPNAPTNLSAAIVSPYQVNLSWTDNSGDEDGFKIERSADGTNFVQIAQALPETTIYRDTTAWPSSAYEYRVCAYNASGDSGYSANAEATTPDLCSTTVISWGQNSGGQVPTPAAISNLVAVAGGATHSLGLKRDHTVIGWGGIGNDYGQVTPPAGLTGVAALAAGDYHSLALKEDGTVVGWGYDYSGEATPPGGLTDVVAIAAGGAHSLALKNDGTVVGWGYDKYGQASPPAGLHGVVAIAAGETHSLALRSDGTVVGWGQNQYGQAAPPAGLTGVVAIAAGDYHSLALKSDGTVVGWGRSYAGETTPPAGLTNALSIGAGDFYSVALRQDHTVVGWGYPRATIPPEGLGGVIALSAGWGHCVAISCAPQAPTGLSAFVVSSNRIDLTWIDNASTESGFRLERALDTNGVPGGWTQISMFEANVTNCSDTTVAPSTRYWYRVQSYNAEGDSPFADRVTVATPPLAPPGSLVATAVSDFQINLAWTDNSTAENSFKLERALDNAGTPGAWGEIASVGSNVTAYTDTGLIERTRYWYRVRAYDGTDYSDYSSPADATTQLAFPTNLMATAISSSEIRLSWTDRSHVEDGFRIDRATATNNQSWMPIATLGPNATAYTNSGLNCGDVFYYRVRAFQGQSFSAYSDIASAGTSSADSDGDGLSDCWTLEYFGHPAGEAVDHSRAIDDADGDGVMNLAEFLAGTNPTNAASFLRITSAALTNGGLNVTWTAVGGKSYVLQTNSDPGTGFGDYSPVITLPGALETTTNYLDPAAPTNPPARYYRVRVVP